MNLRSSFGDAEAKQILQRAAEIDAQRQKTLDASALREIAEEAGISAAAVDAALAEHLESRPTLRARLLQRRGWLIAAGLFAAVLVMRLFP